MRAMRMLDQMTDPLDDDLNNLRAVLKQLLGFKSEFHPRTRFCPDCDAPYEYVAAKFWLDGDTQTFKVSLPFCPKCNPEMLAQEGPVAPVM
jgi:hypothetical protein